MIVSATYQYGGICPKCGLPYYYVGDVVPGCEQLICRCNFSSSAPWFTQPVISTSSSVTPKRTSLRQEIERLGKSGRHVMVRYAPTREKNKWTVDIDGQRIGDTDSPVKLLRTIK